MGETFGHVVPGVFYSVVAIILLILTRQSRDEYALFDFSKAAKRNLGWGIMLTGSFGIFIEGIGGVLHNGDFFLQIAHESMYFGFAVAGLACVLEAAGRMPVNTWRFGLSMAFFVEGLVFYGHALEQRGVEQMLHMIMVFFSWVTSMSFLLSCMFVAFATRGTANRAVFLSHAVGLAIMLAKGLWFFIIADILYSGKFGLDGKEFMIADEFVYAGLLIVSMFSFVGACLFIKPSSAYDEEEEHDIENGIVSAHETEKAMKIGE